MSRLFLAVDGGATKTTLVAVQNGIKLFSATTTGSNYQAIGRARVQRVLEDLLQQLAHFTSSREIAVAVFGMAGIDTAKDMLIVKDIISTSIAVSSFNVGTCIVENDVEATLRGLSTAPATLLIAGTGSICYSSNGKQTIRTGGWGHRIGDEGSGYWIGQQIGRAIVRQKDGRGEPTALTEFVLQGLSLPDTDSFMNWLYSVDYTNARLASFTEFLQPALLAHDAVARHIAQEAANALSELVLAALSQTQNTLEPHTLYFNGGVLKHTPTITHLIMGQLSAVYSNLSYELCDLQPIDYIMQRAQKEMPK